MKPLEWLSNMLSRHGILRLDGRPLYQYRVSDKEFESLNLVLRDASLGGIHKAVGTSYFDLAFVMYGAEWWRRHYEGQWGWEGIFQSFAADYRELGTNQRNTLVETGLRRWQRKVRTSNFRRNFLGSIAIEGGLPLHQLASAGGWLQPTMHQVTKRFVELGEERFEAAYVASQYSQYMPKTFRREEVYEILGGMVTAVVSLKRDYRLDAKDAPVEWLNENHAEWKTGFPLPLDDATGNAILADMIKTAISSKRNTRPAVFPGARFLTGVSTGQPQLNFQLQAQPFYQLESLFAVTASMEIPHRLQLELFNSEGKTWRFADAYRVQWKGRPALKINNQRKQLQGEETIETIRLRFRQLGDVITELDVGADGLDRDVPWAFIKKGDRWQFAGQASQKLSAEEAVVWVPTRLTVLVEAMHWPVPIGKFADGEFFRINQNLSIKDGEEIYSIRVNQLEGTSVDYLISGRRLGYSSKPAELFIGKPKLIALNRVTGQRNAIQNNRVRTRPVGTGSGWYTLDETHPGIHELQIVDGSEIIFRRRIGILPEGTSINHVPGATPKQGTIQINRLGGWQAACSNSDLRVQYNHVGSKLIISLSTSYSPPAELPVEVWQDNPYQPITIILPYPSSGAIIIDPQGTLTSAFAELFTDALHGYRLRFFSRRPGRSDILIRLELSDAELVDPRDFYVEFQKSLLEGSAELPLIDFVSDIRSLLAISKNLDAYVRFSLFSDGAEVVGLKFRRFRVNIEPDRTTGKVHLPADVLSAVSFDELKGLELQTTPLFRPEQAPDSLNSIKSQGIEMGVWRFSPERRSPGPWCIYSSESSEMLVRPLLWSVPGQVTAEQVKSIHAAVCIDDLEVRAETFQALFFKMARDNNHSGWEYFRSLWRRFKHLPLSTFQVWKDAVLNNALLAAMVIQLDPEILDRLEEELPVMWELIPVPTWEEVLNVYRESLKPVLEDEAIIDSIIGDAITRISALNDMMATVAKVVRQRTLDEADDELRLMQIPTARAITADFLAGQHQALLQRQADTQWPKLLKGEIKQAWDQLPDSLSELMPGNQFHRATVVHLPFVLVHKLFVATDELSDPLHVFKYRRLKQFDEDWYSAAYNYACGYWSQQDKEI